MNPNRPDNVVAADALAQVRDLKTEYTDLLRESEERKAALVQIQTLLAELKTKTNAELKARAEVILDLTQKLNDRTASLRRSASGILVTVGAIKTLLEALTASNMDEARHLFPGEVYGAMQRAGEVIRAYGIPF